MDSTKKIYLSLCLISIFSEFGFSQEEKYDIIYKDSVYKISPNFRFFLGGLRHFSGCYYKDNYYLLIQFYELPNKNIREWLDKKGMELLYYVPNMAYISKIPKDSLNSQLRKLKIRSVTCMQSMQKIDKRLITKPYPPFTMQVKGMLDINIIYYEGLNVEEMKKELRKMNINTIALLKPYHKFRIRIPEENLYDVSCIPWIMWVEPVDPPQRGAFK
jgi:hypothetical protein